MKHLVSAALLLTLVAPAARAQVNAGLQKAEPSLPFTMTKVATFNLPWRIAFLPDGRMLDHREARARLARDPAGGRRRPSRTCRRSCTRDRAACSASSCRRTTRPIQFVYLTYAEPGDGGSSLALARARLAIGDKTASLEGLEVIVAADAEGRRWSVRRRRSPFLPTASICS